MNNNDKDKIKNYNKYVIEKKTIYEGLLLK
jgi:hypothetical protein